MDSTQRKRKILQLKHRQQQQQQLELLLKEKSHVITEDATPMITTTAFSPTRRHKQHRDVMQHHQNNKQQDVLLHEDNSMLKYDRSIGGNNAYKTTTDDDDDENPEVYETPPRVKRQQGDYNNNGTSSKVFRDKLPLTPPTVSRTTTTTDKTLTLDERKYRTWKTPQQGQETSSSSSHQRVIRSIHSDSDVVFGVTVISIGTGTTNDDDNGESSFESFDQNNNNNNNCTVASTSSSNLPPTTPRLVGGATKMMRNTTATSNSTNSTVRLPPPSPPQPVDSTLLSPSTASFVRSSPSILLVDDQSSYVSSCSSENNNKSDDEEEGSTTNRVLDDDEQQHQKHIIFVGSKNCIFDVTKSYSSSTADNNDESSIVISDVDDDLSITQILLAANNNNNKNKTFDAQANMNHEDDDDINNDMFVASSETDLHLIHLAMTRSMDGSCTSGGCCGVVGTTTAITTITAENLSHHWYSKALRSTRQSIRTESESFLLLGGRRGNSSSTSNNNHLTATTSSSGTTAAHASLEQISTPPPLHRRYKSDLGAYSSLVVPYYQNDDGGNFMQTMVLNTCFDACSDARDASSRSLLLEYNTSLLERDVTDYVIEDQQLQQKQQQTVLLETDTTATADTMTSRNDDNNDYNACSDMNQCGKEGWSVDVADVQIDERSPQQQTGLLETYTTATTDTMISRKDDNNDYNACIGMHQCGKEEEEIKGGSVDVQNDDADERLPLALMSLSELLPSCAPSPPSLVSTMRSSSTKMASTTSRFCLGSFAMGCIASVGILSFVLVVSKENILQSNSIKMMSEQQQTSCLLYYLLLPFVGFVISRNVSVALLCLYAAQAFQIALQHISKIAIEIDASSIAWGAMGFFWAIMHVKIWDDVPDVCLYDRKLVVGLGIVSIILLCEPSPRLRISFFTLILSFGLELFWNSHASQECSLSLSLIVMGCGLHQLVLLEFSESSSILWEVLSTVSYVAFTLIMGYALKMPFVAKYCNFFDDKAFIALQMILLFTGAACCIILGTEKKMLV